MQMSTAHHIPSPMTSDRSKHVTTIIRDTGRRLMRFIRTRVASDADADDILQDVWQHLYTSLEDGPIEQVSAWLYTVARRRIIDRYRKSRTASLDTLAAGTADDGLSLDLADILPADLPSALSREWRDLFWADLYAALAELPPEQRDVFIWHELEGLPFQEIAATTGENLNTLLSRKRYAVLHLRQRLEPWLEDL